MEVIYSTDENYAPICATSLVSLLENNNRCKDININIIDNKISKESKEKLIAIVKKYERNIKFIDCDEICKDLRKNNNFPIAAYARIFIQDVIKNDKVIYIDCDTIIRQNIEELWDTDINDYLVGGIDDPVPNYLKKAVGMHKEERYINSGILLINLKKWREVDFKKKAINLIKNNNGSVNHHDQGIINAICKGNILYLHPKYNLMPEMIMMSSTQLKKLYSMKNFYSEEELKNANENPSIIHYISKFYNRPWCKDCIHPYKSDYEKYELKTGFEIYRIDKKLDKKTMLRKRVYDNFPFFMYCFLEKILNIKRAIMSKNIK